MLQLHAVRISCYLNHEFSDASRRRSFTINNVSNKTATSLWPSCSRPCVMFTAHAHFIHSQGKKTPRQAFLSNFPPMLKFAVGFLTHSFLKTSNYNRTVKEDFLRSAEKKSETLTRLHVEGIRGAGIIALRWKRAVVLHTAFPCRF